MPSIYRFIHAQQQSWSRLGQEVYQWPQHPQMWGLVLIRAVHRPDICFTQCKHWVPIRPPGHTTFYLPLTLPPCPQIYGPMGGSELLPQATQLFFRLYFEHNLLIQAPGNLRLARFLNPSSGGSGYMSRWPEKTLGIRRIFYYLVKPIKLIPLLLLAQPSFCMKLPHPLDRTMQLSLEKSTGSLLPWLRCFFFPHKPSMSVLEQNIYKGIIY